MINYKYNQLTLVVLQNINIKFFLHKDMILQILYLWVHHD
jgi:hypothetical protein